MCPDPTTGDGGATEGDIRGSFSDIIDTVGVVDLANGHCLVTENSPAALSVLVAPGIVYVPNADYDELDSNEPKFYEAIIDAEGEVTITANTSGSTRIDLICVKVDKTITPDEHASNIATLVAVAGTPGAGTPATPDNHYVLATVAVANGASTIVNTNITSTRVQSKIDFDFLPKATGAEVNTGTSDVTIVTPKALADSDYAKTSDITVTPDSTTTFTNKDLTSETNIFPTSGWNPARETWTYASATTITVPAGAAAKYAKGDKIKLTQTTVKYFYIIGVADTLLTVTGGSDYTVANAAITNPYYSHAENPIGFPDWFSWTPTYTGFSSNPTIQCQFSLKGKNCFIKGYPSSAGTSNATSFKISLPIAPVATGTKRSYSYGWAVDNGSAVATIFKISGSDDAANLLLYKGLSEGDNWTNSGSKYAYIPPMFYEIA